MGNFKRQGGGGGFRGGRGGGNRFGGGRSRFGGGRDRDDKKMHRATCAECNKSCEVPFRPTGERPVYCSDCFEGNKGKSSRDSFSPRESFAPAAAPVQKLDNRGIDDLKRQVGDIEKKIEKILSLLENSSKKSETKAEPVEASVVKKSVEKKAKPVAKKKSTSKKK